MTYGEGTVAVSILNPGPLSNADHSTFDVQEHIQMAVETQESSLDQLMN